MLKIEVIDCWDKEYLEAVLKPYAKLKQKPNGDLEVYTSSYYLERVLNILAKLWEEGVIEDFIPPPVRLQL